MRNVLEYLERAAHAAPSRIAVADRDTSLTFSALRSRAARLGTALRPYAGQAVGVFVGRDADSVAMLLGVLYAGAYYVPLDPTMPPHKREAIAADAAMAAAVGRAGERELACGLPFLTLDALPGDEAPLPACGGDAPAYLVYTSGSTGRPKGVLKSHGAIISFLEAYAATFDLTGEDVIGNQTPFFFDASAKDLYLMLRLGARMEVLPTELFSFPVLLVRYLNERGVTYVCWVPTALAIVTQLNTFTEVLPETLRKVFFVGEAFPVKQLRKWRKALPQVQLVNLYGASELAGICCWYEVGAEVPEPLPMGKPLQNCEVFLRDASGARIEAPGVLGEVCILSPALALGYFGDEALTRERFVPLDGARVFRSGDLAQYDAQGDLVFSCRSDFQIKHMGRRIELGEIESAAEAIEEVGRACCLYQEARKRIVLFCTAAPGWDGTMVKRALRPRLSDYMLPSRVIVLDELPQNANGKIDRMALKQRL